MCISKSQLIFRVREQWDMPPPTTTATLGWALNVIPPLTESHYSSEEWIPPLPALPGCTPRRPSGTIAIPCFLRDYTSGDVFNPSERGCPVLGEIRKQVPLLGSFN